MRLADEVLSSLTGPSVFRRHDLAQRAINFYADADFRVFQLPRLETDISAFRWGCPAQGVSGTNFSSAKANL